MSGEVVPASDGVCDNCRDPSRPSVTPCHDIWREEHGHPASLAAALAGEVVPCGLELCARCARNLSRNLTRPVGGT